MSILKRSVDKPDTDIISVEDQLKACQAALAVAQHENDRLKGVIDDHEAQWRAKFEALSKK